LLHDGSGQALVLYQNQRNDVEQAQEALMLNEEQKKIEVAKKRLARFKVVTREQAPGISMKDQLFKAQQEEMNKRQKTEIGAES